MKKSACVIELMASLGLCEQRLSLGYYITPRGQKLHSWAEHCQTCTFCNLCHSTYRGTVITSDYTYSTGLDVTKECVSSLHTQGGPSYEMLLLHLKSVFSFVPH